MITIKTPDEVIAMRAACRVAAEVLKRMVDHVAVGVSTYELDELARDTMKELGATSASYNYSVGKYKKFPGYTCLSVNEELVHGIGSLKKVLRAGDIISIDVAVIYNGFVGDNATTVMLEPVSPEVKKLVDVTRRALAIAVEQVKPGNRIGDISHAIQKWVESQKFSVVRDFVGHGVGRAMHEEPQIPNYGKPSTGALLKPGMTIAIEPMVNMGSHAVEVLSDGWTVVTVDRKPCAHFEHTVLVTDDSAEILTILKN